jgi:hypothetical protein
MRFVGRVGHGGIRPAGSGFCTASVLALLVGCLVTGCSDGPDRGVDGSSAGSSAAGGSAAREIDRLPTGQVRVAWQRRVRPILQPTVVRDVVVTVVRTHGDRLEIVGLDLVDGRQRWRFDYYTPDETRSPYSWPPVFASTSGRQYAVFQTAARGAPYRPGERRPYLAVDPATGRVVARTRPMVGAWAPVTSDGSSEPADSPDVCLQVGRGTKLRWDLDDFTVHPFPDPHSAGKDGVYYVLGTDTQGIGVIGRDAPGHPSWRRRVRSLIGAHWVADYPPYVGQGAVVLSTSPLPSPSQERRFRRGDRVRIDRGSSRTVGLDLDTGEVLWTHHGSELRCPAVVDAPIRCAFTGELIHQKSWHRPRPRHLRLAVEGFDPHTGETTWSTALSRAAARDKVQQLLADDSRPDRDLVMGPEFGWLPASSGLEVVAWRDGSSRQIPKDAVALCRDERRFRYVTDSASWPLRYTDTFRPCRAADPASRAAGPPIAEALAVAAARAAGGRYVVSYADRLVAYRSTGTAGSAASGVTP